MKADAGSGCASDLPAATHYSGSAYRGSNPWGAAKLSSISCIRPLRIFSERGAKRSYCTSNGLVLKKHCWWERLPFYLQSRLAAK
jgi:hypothetical protein